MTDETPKSRPWTVMVYMAGDNGKVFDTQYGKLKLMASMTQAGYDDLMEMGKVGTTDHVAVTCLFDTQDGTYQVEVRKGQGWADSLVRQVPEVNTGDPNTLRQFIVDSVRAYPADHYALVIWNHGTGWLDQDVYAAVRSLGMSTPLFRRKTARLSDGTTRPIAFDDSSKDFLDTADLRQAFSEAQAQTKVKLDLIGMDACLMAMVEGAQELAEYADYFVGSQEVEPLDGWPYAPILGALDQQPELTPRDVAVRIVTEFARSYKAATRADDTITQSAIDLAHAAQIIDRCRALVDAIRDHADPTLRRTIKDLLAKLAPDANAVLRFQDRNYRDLGDFALKLAKKTEFGFYTAVSQAAQTLYDDLEARTPDASVLQVAYRPKYKGATGLSVFLPPKLGDLLPIYQDLKFPAATGWDKLLVWLNDDFNTQWPV